MSRIKFNNVSIAYPILSVDQRSFRKKLLSAATGGRLASISSGSVELSALSKISLEINAGERVGIVGHNGSGKTTLLRTIAGIYEPATGSVIVKGSVTSLIDIYAGFEPEDNGWDNILLRGLIMGKTRQQINDATAEIAEFSELGDYLNLPMKTYSSGMILRLGFAIATAFPADIVIMDEWLSVGDDSFQKKSQQKLEHYLEQSSILVLATHNETLVNQICNRQIRLKHGEIVEDTQLQPQQGQLTECAN